MGVTFSGIRLTFRLLRLDLSSKSANLDLFQEISSECTLCASTIVLYELVYSDICSSTWETLAPRACTSELHCRNPEYKSACKDVFSDINISLRVD